jgi:hypothetical protein
MKNVMSLVGSANFAVNRRSAALASALALALTVTAVASPSFAQRSEDHMSAARAKVLRECSLLEEKYPESTAEGNIGRYQYLACMSRHGQTE